MLHQLSTSKAKQKPEELVMDVKPPRAADDTVAPWMTYGRPRNGALDSIGDQIKTKLTPCGNLEFV